MRYSNTIRRFFSVGMAGCMVFAPVVAHAQDIATSATASEAFASGVQIYTCMPDGDAYAWRLKAPEATLKDAKGKVVGRHFAGPTWQSSDGSKVVGEAISTSPSPDEGAIPWIVLRAKAHDGNGSMTKVDAIVRTRTEGGMAPATGCDRDHGGSDVRVPYRAVYLFFRHS